MAIANAELISGLPNLGRTRQFLREHPGSIAEPLFKASLTRATIMSLQKPPEETVPEGGNYRFGRLPITAIELISKPVRFNDCFD